MFALALSGCTSIITPINGIPARRLPPQFLAQPRANLVPIDIARLRQDPPPRYLLGPGDILGIYVEGVLGDAASAPPVHFPGQDSDLPPAMGFPIPIREDGTLPLPIVEPMQVSGLTLAQVETMIRNAYTVQRRILQPGNDRITVTLIQERLYQVLVVREDNAVTNVSSGPLVISKAAAGNIVNLPAYRNDVLHALAETGGLPGLNARNEVKILRGKWSDAAKRDAFIRSFCEFHGKNDPCVCMPPLPEDPTIITIPLRLPPCVTPSFSQQDIILRDGDIVYIENREREVFYTGGLLRGGEFPLPRDYDLDVLQAMSIVGVGIGGTGGTGLIAGLGGAPPSKLFILRNTPCGGQITIEVDLIRAINNPAERLLVQAGDTLILRYGVRDETVNFSIGTFFTYGIQQLFNNNN
jgi:protein involved in polysaccharide export with SLBB domain